MELHSLELGYRQSTHASGMDVQKIVTFQPKLSVVRKKQVSDYLFGPLIFSRHADADIN